MATVTNKNNIVYPAIATTLAEVTTLPICTIKTNYQNTSGITVWKTISNIYKTGGLAAFYKASPPAIASQVYSTTSKYFLYRYLEKSDYAFSNKMINGVISGIASSIISHPIDSVKIHWQMNSPLISAINKNGIGILYRGYTKSFAKTCLGSSLFLPIYDYANNHFRNPLYASFFSAIVSTTIIHPVDYLKTRHIYGESLYQGFNLLAYYKGLSLNLMRVVPHFVIIMTTIDFLQNNLK
ncbi:putative oxoglutarate/malate carrier protein [Tupanvirus deep ocean]|uniref:Oxoglutarate/malate carrier protein n=2 Tax=Tupanvirus TaxID=2094720 RepID=A0AC62A913_9VIRU|nr:putative oxoglutarate/malate carrier protein [Tupanvirus deep ocean]QKU34204.1 putative oxoglutarate/malate carrier protein [Tupanvirus deep ocean]